MEPRRLLALFLLAVATASLVAAFRLPFLYAEFVLDLPGWIPDSIAGRMRDWLIDRGRLPVGEHYLLGVIQQLFANHEYVVGCALLLFSVLFPVLKIAISATMAAGAPILSLHLRRRLLHLLAVTGKWSMADVFIVGMIIVFFKADGLHFAFSARPGIDCYAAAALLSSAAVSVVQGGHSESPRIEAPGTKSA